MKKSNWVVLCCILVAISVVSTFFLSTIVFINIGDKVVVNKKDIQQYQELIAKYRDLEDLQKYVLDNYYLDIDEASLIEGMKKGIFEILDDPYSIYMNTDEFKSYLESTTGEYPGIGIYIAPNDANEIEIVSPIEGTPAYDAGLMAKDVIVAVNGELFSADRMDEAIKNIKGEPGTPVTLTIYRPSLRESFDIDIVRQIIDVKVVKSHMIDDTMGYLRLSMFDDNSAKEFDTHMKALMKEGAEGVIIDLRQNPGGYLSQCIEIADLLLGKALIVYTEARNGDEEKYYSDASQYDLEIVVLIDGGSASASEILTGALKDHNAATIVGTKTFGKGVVQIVKPFKGDTGFKLTTSQYFTPSGLNIHGVGIEPDVVVPMDESYYSLEVRTDADDNQLQKAIEILRGKLE